MGRLRRSRGAYVGAVAAGAMVLAFWLSPAASGAGITAAGHPRGGAVEWAGFAGTRSTPRSPGSGRSRSAGSAGGRRSIWLRMSQFGVLPIHYASPMITSANTVLVPTRVGDKAGFRVVAYSGASGSRRWSLDTDYQPPAFTGGFGIWTPPLPAVLTPGHRPGGCRRRRHGAGAKARQQAAGAARRLVFYGAARWRAHRAAYDKAVQITTPLTAGRDGSLYFGFTVTGATPAHLSSGIARIDAPWSRDLDHRGRGRRQAGRRRRGHELRTGAVAVRQDGLHHRHQPHARHAGRARRRHAQAPVPRHAEGPGQRPAGPHLAAARPPHRRSDRTGTSTTASSRIRSPTTTSAAGCLHFNATLTHAKTPGSFGWDNTVSVLPARAVPRYHGTSPYLLVSKYNNYLGIGPHGDGRNRVAVLDPRASQKDPYADARVMKAVADHPVARPSARHTRRSTL